LHVGGLVSDWQIGAGVDDALQHAISKAPL
jgi:hypothetical protein